ncbi:PstS family phosphate ABC transporter substrate-binding protein [Rufibacter roseus]|uniref:PstS family phosphate ABC transporter substrate-binding protein n=1 Tax=Rufibacter roseus TaxID=1567108 RepID=A0ABW2DG34_9BACT|nr:substrate-binding domain-containing protein [Rufibacter roseus]
MIKVPTLYSCLLAACTILIFSACNQSGRVVDTPTAGHIRISVDETFAPIFESQVHTFENIYKNASIEAGYKPEGQVVQDLLNDTIRFAVLTRQLTQQETEELAKQKLTPRATKIAVDGVALIVHKENRDTTLTVQQLQEIFTGKVTKWNQLDPKSPDAPITIVFDNSNSSTSRYIVDSINHNQPLPANVYASKSNSSLVDYVAQNRNAIGVIGVNWISDRDDSTATNFLKKINVVGVSAKSNPTSPDDFVQPYQAYLFQGTYPLRREVFIISKEARAGLGTGFASFVTGDKGQRIILKSGLVPASMPVRLIGLRPE